MQISVQILISALIVLAVLWGMWRIPRKGDALFGAAPRMAFISTWMGLTALIASAALWALPANGADQAVVVVFLGLDPASIACGVLVLWIYRGYETHEDTIGLQRAPAWMGIILGLLAVAVGYAFVMTHKTLFTPVG